LKRIGAVIIGDDVDQWVERFVRARLGILTPFEPGLFKTMGIIRKDTFIGGVIYHNFQKFPTGNIIEFSAAFDTPMFALIPGAVRTMCEYPFKDLNCLRIWTMVAKSNARSRRMCEWMGLKREGSHPLGWQGRETAISYGATRYSVERWIAKDEIDGRLASSTPAVS